MNDDERREAYGQLLDMLAGEAMPDDDSLNDDYRLVRIKVAMQLSQYAFRVRRGDVDPDEITQVAMGLKRAFISKDPS